MQTGVSWCGVGLAAGYVAQGSADVDDGWQTASDDDVQPDDAGNFSAYVDGDSGWEAKYTDAAAPEQAPDGDGPRDEQGGPEAAPQPPAASPAAHADEGLSLSSLRTAYSAHVGRFNTRVKSNS